jgi:hypothetical protein
MSQPPADDDATQSEVTFGTATSPEGEPTPATASAAATPPATPPATSFEWTPELAAGHAPGWTAADDEHPHPVVRAVVWVLGFAVVAWFALVRWAGDGPPAGSTSFETGQYYGRILGSVLGPFLLAFVLWGVRLLFARSGTRRRRVFSPVVPALAVVIALVGLSGGTRATGGTASNPAGSSAAPSASTAATATRRTRDEAMAIAAPYRLETAQASEASQIVDQMTGGDRSLFKSIEVHRIVNGTDLIGYVVLADADVGPGFDAVYLAQFERGMAGSGTTASHATVNGREILTGTTGGAGFAVWIEAPFLKIVFTATPSDARGVADKFVHP